jgi:hypothetical protein
LLCGLVPADYAVWRLQRELTKPPIAAQSATLAAYVCAGAGAVVFLLALT